MNMPSLDQDELQPRPIMIPITARLVREGGQTLVSRKSALLPAVIRPPLSHGKDIRSASLCHSLPAIHSIERADVQSSLNRQAWAGGNKRCHTSHTFLFFLLASVIFAAGYFIWYWSIEEFGRNSIRH